MSINHAYAERIARQYTRAAEPLERLGFGVDGVVYSLPSATNAIKAHGRRSKFFAELEAYQRLGEYGVTTFEGFHVPRLVGYDEMLQVIVMTAVRPPFLLDFAGA